MDTFSGKQTLSKLFSKFVCLSSEKGTTVKGKNLNGSKSFRLKTKLYFIRGGGRGVRKAMWVPKVVSLCGDGRKSRHPHCEN